MIMYQFDMQCVFEEVVYYVCNMFFCICVYLMREYNPICFCYGKIPMSKMLRELGPLLFSETNLCKIPRRSPG